MPVKVKPVTVLMTNKLQAAAKALAIKAPEISVGAGKTYEAWILLELAARLKVAGIAIAARDHTGTATKTYRVSGGPSYIRPRWSTKTDEPCYFELQGTWHTYELHNGIRHLGSSGDDHEMDVSVFAKSDADGVRNHNGGPFVGARWMALELKEYDSKSHLPKIFPRALLGTAVDLDPQFLIGEVSFKLSHSQWAIVPPRRPNYWLVSTAQIRTNHASFLRSYEIDACASVSPEQPSTAFDEIVSKLRAQLW